MATQSDLTTEQMLETLQSHPELLAELLRTIKVPVVNKRPKKVEPSYNVHSIMNCQFCGSRTEQAYYYTWDVEKQLHRKTCGTMSDCETKVHSYNVPNCPACDSYLQQLDKQDLIDFVLKRTPALDYKYRRLSKLTEISQLIFEF